MNRAVMIAMTQNRYGNADGLVLRPIANLVLAVRPWDVRPG